MLLQLTLAQAARYSSRIHLRTQVGKEEEKETLGKKEQEKGRESQMRIEIDGFVVRCRYKISNKTMEAFF